MSEDPVRLKTYCVDVGSVPRKKFAWARVPEEAATQKRNDIRALAGDLAKHLTEGLPVALGFEAPMFVPVPSEDGELGTQRPFEIGRPWSAGAGVAALGSGIVQAGWILREIHDRAAPPPATFLDWNEFRNAGSGLFLWEALVSHKTGKTDDYRDALAGARKFHEDGWREWTHLRLAPWI